ncbi:5'-3' exoribonuclease 2 [Chamberlinius hualienensis]
MGVPAFFRWLSRKYPSIVAHCVEDKPQGVDGVQVPVDCCLPNPNGIEFDNLYLDMNGIIHPCCHPENKAAPKNEDEMMVAIFEYIDRLFRIIRPRRLLYMAIDGVAPRAKMNQQRSRRFRASKETIDKVEEISKVRQRLEETGANLPPEKTKEEHFDSNCITPGTPFMDRLAKCLHYYIHERMNSDPAWRKIEVILSDANVPGEGEHKIMDFIRRQRAMDSHDPNTHHCLCGADADLIMLGLATHEANFTIIREEFRPNQPRPCELCGQAGHEMKNCMGLPRVMQGEFNEIEVHPATEQEFIFIRLNVLREYLERELEMHNLPFPYDFERALDDWVFMCFFVGNDFLPHLPSLEIREGAIDRLIGLYKRTVYNTGGYLTDNGLVNLLRVQVILNELGEMEDEIFKRRQENEISFKMRQKEKKKRMKPAPRPLWVPSGQFAPVPIGSNPEAVQDARKEAYNMRVEGMSKVEKRLQNVEAAKALQSMLKGVGDESATFPQSSGVKRKSGDAKLDSDSEEEIHDDVRLWEDGWKDRYYENKFQVSADNMKFRHQVADAYAQGLCWVLQYYYQGCPSWKWYFPYHYAPFASDFVNLDKLSNRFEKGTQPFNPLEQLMGVFPAASKQHLPDKWAELMCSSVSPIIDFYPIDFKIDLNGKKFAWQGVALLPFVDERRLLATLTKVYPTLTDDENRRNVRGDDRIYVHRAHKGFEYLVGFYEGKKNYKTDYQLEPSLFYGLSGTILLAKDVVEPGGVVHSPVPGCPDLCDNGAICLRYRDPKFNDDHLFAANRNPKAKEPLRVLKPSDLDAMARRNYRPMIGMAPSTRRASLGQPGHRMIRHATRNEDGYNAIPPPDNYGGRTYRGGRGGAYYNQHQQYGGGGRGYYSGGSGGGWRNGPNDNSWRGGGGGSGGGGNYGGGHRGGWRGNGGNGTRPPYSNQRSYQNQGYSY